MRSFHRDPATERKLKLAGTIATWILIAIFVAVFVWAFALDPNGLDQWVPGKSKIGDGS